jgi:uroporphyrinogen-III synthase
MALFGNVLNKRVQIAAIGASTAAAAEKLIGRQPEFVSASSSSEDFAKGLLEHIKHID